MNDQSGQSDNKSLLVETLAAIAMAVGSISMSISMAALVFSGSLSGGLPRAVTAFVIAGAVAIGYLGLRSQIVPLAALVQDGPAVVMVAVAAGVAGDANKDSVDHVFVLIAIATIVTGVIMLVMGQFGLGHLVRYIPNTVVTAFIAGTGWLLVKGGLDVMVGFGVELGDVSRLFDADILKFWVPGLGLGILIWLLGHLNSVPPLLMSLAILGSIACFFAVVGIWSSIDAVEAGGWLIGPFPGGNEFSVVSPSSVVNANWEQLLPTLPSVGGVVAVAVIALLLNVTGLEFVGKERIEVDTELRETGLVNVVLSPLGALPAFHALGDSVLASRLGARTRLMPVLAAVATLGFGVFGLVIAGYMPRLVVGALLISVGLALLVDWVQTLVKSIHPLENAMSVAIVLVIAFVGILQGIGVGIIAACAVFVVRYSRIDPVKRSGSGTDYRSRVDYSPDQTAYLLANADRIKAFQLQGYLFFGSLTSLDDRVRGFLDRTSASDGHDAVIFDFRNVTGIDSSAYELLARVTDQITERGNDFVIAHMGAELRESLKESEPIEMSKVSWAPNLDAALEHAERSQLTRWSAEDKPLSLDQLGLSEDLLAEFTSAEFSEGHVLMTQGASSDELLIVRSGYLTATRFDGDGVGHRLRRFGIGALVGEIGFITGGERTAQVTADTPVVAVALTRARYEELLEERPKLVIELQSYMLKGQAGRITSISEGLARSLR